ncbi:MAG: hypothetical protein V3T17_15935 [Pseudomonadales bacterium]
MSQYNILENIYNKHRRNFKENGDSKQICCMWSTNDPPDVIEGTEPIVDIEQAFDVQINEDGALELYDMTLNEAINYINVIKKKQS